MASINWSYMAGFFDGEGCVCFSPTGSTGKGKLQCHVSQTREVGKLLLEEIRDFLLSHGIDSHLYSWNMDKYNPNRRGGYHKLVVTRWDHAVTFLRSVFPYLKIKRVIAQDVIRYHCLFPYMLSQKAKVVRREGLAAYYKGRNH